MNSDAHERISLTRQIESTLQVQKMDDSELQEMSDAHEIEMALISAKLQHADDSDDMKWKRALSKALNVLKVHMAWITKEQHARELKAEKDRLAADRAAKAENLKRAVEMKEKADKAKEERIKAANCEDRRNADLFREVVLETVGREMYLCMWQAVNQRKGAVQ